MSGGSSRRMGTDKALLDWRGATLIEWVASQVRQAVGNVNLVGAQERYAGLALAAIGEASPGLGPLSGLEAALRHSDCELNLVVACDMPVLRAAALRDLAQTAAQIGADVCAAVRPDGGLEPLCAVYHRRLLPQVQAALREDRPRMRDLLAQWKVVHWANSRPGLTANVNRPEDWEIMLNAGD